MNAAWLRLTYYGRTHRNRFSRDMSMLDRDLHQELFEVVECGMSMVGTMTVLTLANPLFAVAVPIMFFCYHRMQRYYVVAAREIERLESTTTSPVHAHFASTLSGCVTIRAFGAAARFGTINDTLLDVATNADWTQRNMIWWLDTRVHGFIGVPVTGVITRHGIWSFFMQKC